MKFLILVSSLLALASASWEPIHEKYHGPLHYPKIHKGVPVEPAAVQHAREAHLMALYQASNNNEYSHHDHHDDHHEHYEHEHKWQGPKHYPVIHKGVPIEPKEVQDAREAHLTALSYASHDDQSQDYDHHYEDNQYSYEYHGNHEGGHKWHGPLHYPKIHKGVPVEPVEVQKARAAHLKALFETHNHGEDYSYSNQHHEKLNHYETPMINHDGKPLDTHDVEAAKSEHFAAVHDAIARNSHGISRHYRKRRGAESYVHFSNVVEHEVPVKHDQHDKSHYENYDHEAKYNGENEGEYFYEQIHAPVYGHFEDDHDNSQEYADHQIYAPVDDHHQSFYGFSYEQIHAPVYGQHDSHHYHQIPVIGHDGTPVDTPEVQHAKAAHLAAHAAARSKHY